ncbi:MAG TPA: hypothetical protein VGR71_06130 [Nitrospira sp.]|nr:hypothetical protein [Nitrospira sp.]
MSNAKRVPDAKEISAALVESPGKEDHDFAEVFGKRHESEPDQGWNLLQGCGVSRSIQFADSPDTV